MSDGTGLARPRAATGLRCSSLEAALRREQKKVALVQEVSRALSTTGDLDALLTPDHGEGHRADGGRSLDAVPGHRGRPPAVVQGRRRAASGVEIRLEVGEGIAGWVAQTREIVNIPDAYADQRFQPAVDLKSGYRTRSILSVPMLGALGGLVGVLQVLNKQRRPVHARRRGAADRAREPGRDRDRERAALSLAGRAEPGAAARAPRPRAPARASSTRCTRSRRSCRRRSISTTCCRASSPRRSPCSAVAPARSRSSSPTARCGSAPSRGPAAPRLIERTLPHGTGLLGWSIAHRTPIIVDDPAQDPRHAAEVARGDRRHAAAPHGRAAGRRRRRDRRHRDHRSAPRRARRRWRRGARTISSCSC